MIEGPAGLAAPRWSCSYEDALGRTICETRPGFRGALLVTSNEYNTANQLVATRSYSSNSNSELQLVPLAYTYICYNFLGQRILTVSDMNLNGEIDWIDTDRIVSNDTRYVSLDGDWWRESSTWLTRQNGSPALTRVGFTRTRLTGLGRARTLAAPQEEFVPQYDFDGDQTLVKTATGVWSVTYNGENRPVLWTQGTNTISMSFYRMGRRVTKNDQCFVYDGYLRIAEFITATPHSSLLLPNFYVWDPSEPVATRQLAWLHQAPGTLHQAPLSYTHDGNKNVSDVVGGNGDIVAHYEYAPFGDLILQYGISAAVNPWCFSSEYAENDTAMLCYNYRHCDIHLGRWINPDPICVPMYDCKNKRWTGIDIYGSDMKALYYFLENSPCNAFDYLGLRITEQECKALINRLWFFNYESGLDVDVFGMKVEIESGWGCENPCRLKN